MGREVEKDKGGKMKDERQRGSLRIRKGSMKEGGRREEEEGKERLSKGGETESKEEEKEKQNEGRGRRKIENM